MCAVGLSFKIDPKVMLPDNWINRALICLRQLEKRLGKDDDLRVGYHKAIQKYIDLGHMERAASFIEEDWEIYYLSHHPAVMMESITSRMRSIYDVSAKT